MSIQEKQIELLCRDPKRVGYMLGWRDRHIEKLQKRVAGHEEESNILYTLLFYAMSTMGEQDDNGHRVVEISKAAVSAALGTWHCEVEDGGDSYRLRFMPGARESAILATESDEEVLRDLEEVKA
ncbi:MAG: hypothetical protein IJY50_08850 [Clostridia bacterium]|nr:hypothetical protein [Clostridia bacterium]